MGDTVGDGTLATKDLGGDAPSVLGHYIDAVSGRSGAAAERNGVPASLRNRAGSPMGDTVGDGTLATKDLGGDALSVLGHYIDAVSGRSGAAAERNGVPANHSLDSRGSSSSPTSLPPAAEAVKAAIAARAMEERSSRRDPPTIGSLSTDNSIDREDPPLALTPSQEVGRWTNVAERNPHKAESVASEQPDPEQSKRPMVDLTGEPNLNKRLATSPFTVKPDPSLEKCSTDEKERFVLENFVGGDSEVKAEENTKKVVPQSPEATSSGRRKGVKSDVPKRSATAAPVPRDMGKEISRKVAKSNENTSKRRENVGKGVVREHKDTPRESTSKQTTPKASNIEETTAGSKEPTAHDPLSAPKASNSEGTSSSSKEPTAHGSVSAPLSMDSVEAADDSTMIQLWSALSKSIEGRKKNAKNCSYSSFEELFYLAFPFFDGKQPSAVDCARLQVQARKRKIPVAMTNVLLERLKSLQEREVSLGLHSSQSSPQAAASNPKLRQEALLQRLLEVQLVESRRNVMIYTTEADGNDEEAVEIDLSDIYKQSTKESPPQSDFSDGDKWWEAAAKLSKIAEEAQKSREEIDDPAMEDTDGDSSISADDSRDMAGYPSSFGASGSFSMSRQPRTLAEDINGFWQKHPKPGKRYGRKPRGKLPMSFSTERDASAVLSGNRSGLSGATGSTASTFRHGDDYDEDMWVRRREMALWHTNGNWLTGKHIPIIDVDEPEPIDAVAAAALFERPSFMVRRRQPSTRQWRLPYNTRTEGHPGYFTVDINSLYASLEGSLRRRRHPLDSEPWEHREVKQRFLHEQSISYNRNWFGTTKKVYGNSKIRQPVCRPKSMEMPMKVEEWTKEWYTKPWTGAGDGGSLCDASTNSDLQEIQKMRRRYNIGVDDSDDDSCEEDEEGYDDWEETPECGTLRNVRLRPGERITRVTPDLTSSLRRSRWRKKHFPKGTFPYRW